MPERNGARRIDASSVQGEGAWIESTPLLWGEYEKASNGEINDGELLRLKIATWNYVDAEGNPIPQPPEGVASLTMSEVRQTVRVLFDAEAEEKN
jgi:hypothetical protein